MGRAENPAAHCCVIRTLLPLALKKPSQNSTERNSSKLSGSRPANSCSGMMLSGHRSVDLLGLVLREIFLYAATAALHALEIFENGMVISCELVSSCKLSIDTLSCTEDIQIVNMTHALRCQDACGKLGHMSSKYSTCDIWDVVLINERQQSAGQLTRCSSQFTALVNTSRTSYIRCADCSRSCLVNADGSVQRCEDNRQPSPKQHSTQLHQWQSLPAA